MKWPHISQIVSAAAAGFVLGVAGALWTQMPRDTVFFCAGLAGIVIFLLFARTRGVWIVAVCLLAFVGGFLRTQQALNYADTHLTQSEKSGHVTLVTTLTQSGYMARGIGVFDDGLRVLLRLPKHAAVVHGDIITVTCVLTTPESFDAFDYQKYLLMQRINYICETSEYAVVGQSKSALARIAAVRRVLEHNVTMLVPAPAAALANGLLFGGDDRLSKELQDAFARTGMSHIVAVSGYNVTVIVLAVTSVGIFLGLWRKQAALASIVVVLLFVAMIGFPASGVRAAIMGTLVLFAVVYGRAAHAFGALLLAAAGMLLVSPLQLRYDVGFQLSFLAVIGILLFYPLFERSIIAQRKSFGFLEILFLTISAQLFVLPVILFHFQTLSLSSLMTNILVLPILPVTMFFVFCTAVVSMLTPIIAQPFAWAAYWFLTYEIEIIRFFAAQTWNSIAITTFSISLALLYYIALLVIAYYFYRRNDTTRP